MVNELKPCPFCGGTVLRSGGDDKVVGFSCLRCEASGPNHYGEFEWNTRADTGRLSELEAEAARLRIALMDATANLSGCVSAYATYSCRHRSAGRGRADPFFTTRLMDFRRAEERARSALEGQS